MRKYNVEMKWGIIMAIGMFLYEYALYLSGYHDARIDAHPYMTMYGFGVMIITLVLGILEKRRKYFPEKMTYVHGLTVGILIGAFSLPLSLVLTFLMVEVVSPEYFNNAIDAAVARNISEDVAASSFNTKMYMVQTILGVMGASVFFSIIIAVFTKKNA